MPENPVFVETWTVSEEDLDELRHVNNLQYIRWTLNAASAHSRHVGWPSDRYREMGFGWVVRSHNITYKVPALAGDEILIRTWIADMERMSSLRKYEIVRSSDDRVCALAETRWVFVDLSTHKLTQIPQEIRDAFSLPKETHE